ncbi:hypothetical protein D7X33_13105 [Butyricicoccus sp. 1XD8-22]|nr:hypothetical protein D7X33_13105 [Butyricicoccus sp. 1XD8-22]
MQGGALPLAAEGRGSRGQRPMVPPAEGNALWRRLRQATHAKLRKYRKKCFTNSRRCAIVKNDFESHQSEPMLRCPVPGARRPPPFHPPATQHRGLSLF